MRQIAIDTETTGREIANHHRIIEIGAILLEDRRISQAQFQAYLNPQRASDPEALAVHGLSEAFLSDKPSFPEVVESFLAFIQGAELIIHNAPFDVGFLDYELQRTGKRYGKLSDYCTILDTLPLARRRHPGQRNSLDALCKRYNIDHSHRTLHGALLDAELLARVWLKMTAGQSSLFGEDGVASVQGSTSRAPYQASAGTASAASITPCPLPVIRATSEEKAAHQQRLAAIAKASGTCLWDAAS